MKIISLIHEPDVIERILRHLELWKHHPDLHLKKSKTPDPGPVVMEDFDDGWPGYEEPVTSSTTKLRRRRQSLPATIAAVCPQTCPGLRSGVWEKTLFQALRKRNNVPEDQFAPTCPSFPQHNATP